MKLKENLSKFMGAGLLAMALTVAGTPAQAAYITGTLDINGNGVLVNNLGIDWLDINGNADLLSPVPPPTTTGNFRYQGPTHTDDFIGATNAISLGTIRDLPAGLGSGALFPSLNNFFAFDASYGAGLNGANFVLDILDQGNFAANNPINLFQTSANRVDASIGGRGRIIDSNGDTSYFTFSITTQFTNQAGISIADVVQQAQTTGIQSSWSGQIDADVLEPATFALVGGVLLGVGLLRRRRLV